MVAYLKAKSNKYHVASSKVGQHINKYFHEMKVGDVDTSSPFEYEIVHGSKNMHQVWFISNKDLTLCQYCQLSCMCVGCIDHNLDYCCVYHEHVLDQTLIKLRFGNAIEVREMMCNSDEEIEAGTCGEWIANNLYLGDNITIMSFKVLWMM